MQVFVANFKLGSSEEDLYEYRSKCLSLLKEKKRDNMCKRFCWTGKGKTYIKTCPMFQDIDVDFPIKTIIKASKEVFNEYFGNRAKSITLKKKSGNKYHVYYTNIFVDKPTLCFLNAEINKRLEQQVIDENCSFPRLEGFNKWKWTKKPVRNKDTGKYDHFGEGHFDKDSYYEPMRTKFSWKQVYKHIYNFNQEPSTLIKPITHKQKQKYVPKIRGGSVIHFKDLDVIDEQLQVINEFELLGSIKKIDDCYMTHIVADCPFREHSCGNHRYIIIDQHKIILKCFCHKCADDFEVLWKKPQPCSIVDSDSEDNDQDNDDKKEDIFDDYNNEAESTAFSFLYQNIDEFNNDYFDIVEYKTIFFKNYSGADNYSAIKEYVENYFFKINDPPCFLDNNGKQVDIKHILNSISFKEIITDKKGKEHEIVSPFIQRWVRDMNIKYYNTYNFYPPPICPPKNKNIYNVFKLDKYWANIQRSTKKSCPKMVYHFEQIICNNDKRVIKYLIAYTYHLIKYPAHNPQIFLVFYSNIKGAGKNTFPYMLSRLMGGIYWDEVEGSEYFKDNSFNGIEDKKILLVINESNAGKKSIVESLKARLTNLRKKINKKHEKEMMILNIIRYILTTNQANSVRIDSGRRFMLNEVNDSKAGDTQYFNELFEEMSNDDCIRAFWDYILDDIDAETKSLIDMGKYNFQNNRPITEYYKEVLVRNLDNFTLFLGYLIYEIDDMNAKIKEGKNNITHITKASNNFYHYTASIMRSRETIL